MCVNNTPRRALFRDRLPWPQSAASPRPPPRGPLWSNRVATRGGLLVLCPFLPPGCWTTRIREGGEEAHLWAPSLRPFRRRVTWSLVDVGPEVRPPGPAARLARWSSAPNAERVAVPLAGPRPPNKQLTFPGAPEAVWAPGAHPTAEAVSRAWEPARGHRAPSRLSHPVGDSRPGRPCPGLHSARGPSRCGGRRELWALHPVPLGHPSQARAHGRRARCSAPPAASGAADEGQGRLKGGPQGPAGPPPSTRGTPSRGVLSAAGCHAACVGSARRAGSVTRWGWAALRYGGGRVATSLCARSSTA